MPKKNRKAARSRSGSGRKRSSSRKRSSARPMRSRASNRLSGAVTPSVNLTVEPLTPEYDPIVVPFGYKIVPKGTRRRVF